jgi:hypothetical protein
MTTAGQAGPGVAVAFAAMTRFGISRSFPLRLRSQSGPQSVSDQRESASETQLVTIAKDHGSTFHGPLKPDISILA